MIDDTLHKLSGSKYFSTLDLKLGYWYDVEMDDVDKENLQLQDPVISERVDHLEKSHSIICSAGQWQHLTSGQILT